MPAPQPSAPGPLRFAHPFFTDIPPEQRPPSPRFGRRMLDHIGFEIAGLQAFCKRLASLGVTFDAPYTKNANGIALRRR